MRLGDLMSDPHIPDHFIRRVPEGDSLERDVCDHCGYVHYHNPKIIAGAVVHYDGRILLCRRAINPRRNYWTIPAGFMELNETVSEAAVREAFEEACADITIERILAIYSIPHLSQVQIMHIAHLKEPVFSAGEESIDVDLFGWDDIPWNDLAFPSVHWALRQYDEIQGQADFPVFTNPEGQTGRPAAPNHDN